MPLTDTRLRALKPKDKPYKVTDERGLYVEVTPTGGKLWRFRYRIGGAQKKLCIGSYPEISLKQARDAAYEARRAVASGGDPAFEKRKRKIRAEFLSAQTFEAVAREYIEQMMVQNGRADGTIVKANYFLDKLAPAIGNRPINEIEPFEVLAPLKRLEATGKHETAKKCRSFAGRVFRYGVATTRCKSDPTSMLKGALVTPRAKHYAAILEPTELGGLLRAIDDFTGYMVTKLALQIAPHVFVRPGELRHAEWHEIDLVDGVWKIPAGKMKARRAHAVPLSKQVRGYLTDLAEMLGREGYVFPSARSSKRPMSENTLNAAFRRMGYSKEEVTAHGLRATASTFLNESGLWNPDAIERALAHGDSNVEGFDAISLFSGSTTADLPEPASTRKPSAAALRIWRDAQPLRASPAKAYLESRGILAASQALRFHPRTPLGPKGRTRFLTAMIAAVSLDEGPIAIHRTFLSGNAKADFEKPKRALGALGEAAVRLFAPVSGKLGLAEGIESAMSAYALTGIPAWRLAMLVVFCGKRVQTLPRL